MNQFVLPIKRLGRYNISFKGRAFALLLRAMEIPFKAYKCTPVERHAFFCFLVYTNIHSTLIDIASQLGVILIPYKPIYSDDIEDYVYKYCSKLPLSL